MVQATVMTWNVQNLLQPDHEDGPDDDQIYMAKLASLAAVINREGPDIIGLQEVGPAPARA